MFGTDDVVLLNKLTEYYLNEFKTNVKILSSKLGISDESEKSND